MALVLTPTTISDAKVFVERHHRHHGAPQGALFAVAVSDGDEVVGVATVGRPSARMLQDGYTAEVTRVCVLEGHPNACSMLYAAAWRAARALGYRRCLTYVLVEESGTSVKAAGWREIGAAGGGSWSRPSRPRVDRHQCRLDRARGCAGAARSDHRVGANAVARRAHEPRRVLRAVRLPVARHGAPVGLAVVLSGVWQAVRGGGLR